MSEQSVLKVLLASDKATGLYLAQKTRHNLKPPLAIRSAFDARTVGYPELIRHSLAVR